MIINTENFLGNWSFGLSLISMFIYWIQAAFFYHPGTWNRRLKQLGFFGILIVNLLLAALLLFRWKVSNHFPLSNLYESLIFLTWGISFVHLFLERLDKETYLGVIFSPILLCISPTIE